MGKQKIRSLCPNCYTELCHIIINKEDVFGCPNCVKEVSFGEEITQKENMRNVNELLQDILNETNKEQILISRERIEEMIRLLEEENEERTKELALLKEVITTAKDLTPEQIENEKFEINGELISEIYNYLLNKER